MNMPDDDDAGEGSRGVAEPIAPAGAGIAGGAPVAADQVKTVKPCLVLGYDHTDGALAAAGWAANELVPDGKLVVVHATRALHMPPLPIPTPRERHRLGHVLIDELLLEGTDSLFDVELQVEISDDDPVTALTKAACRHDARAIVVGHDGHSWMHRALGTVTSQLLNASSVPVVVVPRELARPAGASLTAPAR
jgi:nucleotide-binding universal stress UspA family protein